MKSTLLLILDGWGHRVEREHNAIVSAHTPIWDKLSNYSPITYLNASGSAVGLPEGQMGNSEVGHLHIGAGRCVPQKLSLIEQKFQKGHIRHHPEIVRLAELGSCPCKDSCQRWRA